MGRVSSAGAKRRIVVDLAAQRLALFAEDGACIRRYAVSTAAKGPGEQQGSNCTPRGRHRIRAKIGAGAPPAAVFVGRRATGEVWTPALAERHPKRDWILSRILWLSGCEPGRNRLGAVDSMRRYIYIHGTPDDQPMGEPRSHGCIRMRNRDVIELFELVEPGTEVDIVEHGAPAALDLRIEDWPSAGGRVLPLRIEVFVIEQGVPAEMELDEFDPRSRHAVATVDGRVVATGRLLPDGYIGRMAVAAAWRGRGLGGAVLEALVAEATAGGMAELVLHAQVRAQAFYARHGFVAEGEVFMEAGIPHRSMRRKLSGA